MVLEKDAKNKLDWKKNKWWHLKDDGGKEIIDKHSKEKEMADDRTLTKTWRQTRLIIEGMIEGTQPSWRPRTKYISQIIKDAGVTFYKELKDMANDKITEGKFCEFIWKINLWIEKKIYIYTNIMCSHSH